MKKNERSFYVDRKNIGVIASVLLLSSILVGIYFVIKINLQHLEAVGAGYMALLFLTMCLLFWTLWLYLGTVGIQFVDETIILRRGRSEKIIVTTDIKMICVVQSWIPTGRYGAGALKRKIVFNKENGKIKISIVNMYSVCFITDTAESHMTGRRLLDILDSDKTVRECFKKLCVITLPYSDALMEEIVQLGASINFRAEVLEEEIGTYIVEVLREHGISEPIIKDKVAVIEINERVN